MADKSILSIRGEVNWATGDYSNVINSTKRMMQGMNAATTTEIRAGQRASSAAVQAGLDSIEKQENKSAKKLVKSKQAISQQLAQVEVKRKTPPPVTDRSSDAIKKKAKDVEAIVKAGENAHKRLQALQSSAGAKISSGSAYDPVEFGKLEASERQQNIDLQRTGLESLRDEIAEKEKDYKLAKKQKKAYVHLREEKEALELQETETVRILKLKESQTRRLIGSEKVHKDELRKLSDAKRKLYKLDKEIYHKTVQSERDLKQINKDLAEEIGRVRQEAGEGLRNAFTYATVAITAFWYKLMPVVETFKEFEAELVNAQSIWKNSQSELNELSDEVVQFGQNFGINMGKATEGLYQYASAGVEAAEAMKMLNHTLTLSMAVQGDHNTLAKLTTQTIMGFGMEFDQAGEVTDKFAHAINMSLIEWEDLASSVKFALPFFTSTGQSLDQLLGALSVLTNRALEAGIAGRGLRQALAEFTQHADDNSAAFAKMGVEILDAEGNMRQLTDIAAQFQAQMGDGVKDMDIMMALMEDLNIRGATAFVHLVQNADEFQQQVDDLQNSAGAAAEMAEIQQKSLQNQIQLVRNAMQAPFLMSDEIGEAAGYTNEFAMMLHEMVTVFESLIVVEKEGTKQLTEFGQFIKDFVIGAMRELMEMVTVVRDLFLEWGKEGHNAAAMLHVFTVPLKVVLLTLKHLGPGLLTVIIMMKTMNKILPTNIMQMWNMIQARKAEMAAVKASLILQAQEHRANSKKHKLLMQAANDIDAGTAAMWRQVQAQMALQAGLFLIIWAAQKWGKDSPILATAIGAVTGAVTALAIALSMSVVAGTKFLDPRTWIPGVGGAYALAGILAAGAAVGLGISLAAQQAFKPPDVSIPNYEPINPPEFATGGRVMYPRTSYATGGRVAGGTHFPVMVEGGETIISKTQNMASGGASGITIQIHGDVYDGDNFAQKIGQALPIALRNVNDIGGM
jgi:TP901 family phage tail tape measure protein